MESRKRFAISEVRCLSGSPFFVREVEGFGSCDAKSLAIAMLQFRCAKVQLGAGTPIGRGNQQLVPHLQRRELRSSHEIASPQRCSVKEWCLIPFAFPRLGGAFEHLKNL